MAETAVTPVSNETLDQMAGIAHLTITHTQRNDYFSERGEAEGYARREGIDLDLLRQTGPDDEYTAVPRTYPKDLEQRLRDTFAALSSEEPLNFLHIDRYAVTIGNTGNEPQPISLVKQPNTGFCSLRLGACDFVRFETIPQQTEEPQAKTGEPVELPLSRNILMTDSSHEDRHRAIGDGLRDWERVLITGDNMMESYLVACIGYYGTLASSEHGNTVAAFRKREAISQALGVLLDSEIDGEKADQ